LRISASSQRGVGRQAVEGEWGGGGGRSEFRGREVEDWGDFHHGEKKDRSQGQLPGKKTSVMKKLFDWA